MESSKIHAMPNLWLILVVFAVGSCGSNGEIKTIPMHVGVILNMDTLVGKMGRTSISMAIDDFYSLHPNYTTRVVLHFRDSNSDVVEAAASAVDLLENTQVKAIIGPQSSSQAFFLSQLADKAQAPLLSFSATSPLLSSIQTPYFINTMLNDSYQVNGPLSSLIQAFKWKEVALIYEDSEYGRGIIVYLVDAFQKIGAKMKSRSVIPLSLSDDEIREELYKLMTMEARVFIVHVTSPVANRLFSQINEVGMMSEGYAWIITSGLSNIVNSLDTSIVDSMQGSLGVKLYVPKSKKLDDFSVRWKRRFQNENPTDEPAEPSILELWAYDTAWALAIAAEKVGVEGIENSSDSSSGQSTTTSLESLKASVNGRKLLDAILDCSFSGLSGKFHLIDRQRQSSSSTFEIINVNERGRRQVGFWSPKYGLSRKPINGSRNLSRHSNTMADLNPIIWPGNTVVVPKGWQSPITGRKLRIGVPIKEDFKEFVKVEKDPLTNVLTVTGFSIDVFEAVVQTLPYALSYEYVPFEDHLGLSNGSYDDLVYQVYLQNYDAVVGDVTIIANRSLYVDFTLPYSETGMAMLVPVKEKVNKNAWIFLKPMSMDLWLASFAFFIFTGFVVWVMEHQVNSEFRGSISQQLGTVFYFAFSTLVFAHRERVENFFSKLVVIVWLFAVLILTSSYTATLSSMLTVRSLQPTVTDVNQLKRNGDYVGYQNGSFSEGVLKKFEFEDSKMRAYENPEEYADALTKGSQNGGVSAIFHCVPNIKLFLARHCKGFAMVGPVYRTGGMGFVFPKGSPLVPDISRGILDVTEGDIMVEIETKWFGDQVCIDAGNTLGSDNLSFSNFWGLFLITGAASTSVLVIFFTDFFYENWHELRRIGPEKSISQKFTAWFDYFNRKDLSSDAFKMGNIGDEDYKFNLNNDKRLSNQNSIKSDGMQQEEMCSVPVDLGSDSEGEEQMATKLAKLDIKTSM